MENRLNLLDIVDYINNKLNIPIVSLPYSILIELFDQDDIRPQHFRSNAMGSPARFYTTLSTLEAAGQIVSLRDPVDRRAKLYRLSNGTRQQLLQLHALLPDWLDNIGQSTQDRPQFIEAFSRKNREILNVAILSTEYQLILHLFDAGELTASALQNMSDASVSTFFKCLKQMIVKNLIIGRRDAQDKRIIHYRLTDHVRPFMHESNMRARDWVQMKLAPGKLPS